MSWAEQPGGRLTATNMSVAMIIRNAFKSQESQLSRPARLGLIGAVATSSRRRSRSFPEPMKGRDWRSS